MRNIFLSLMVLSAFVIATPKAEAQSRIIITSPKPYETIEKGSYIPIRWAGYARSDLSLYYRNKETGRRQLIRENINPNDNIYWSIPTSLRDGEYDLILESQTGGRHTIQVKLIGEAKRKVPKNAREVLTLKNPNGGESYRYNEPVRISWDHTDLGNNELDILLGAPNPQGKIVWTHIATDVPGNWDGFTWYPNRYDIEGYLQQHWVRGTPRFKILIVDRHNQNGKDTSDGYFTIR